MTSQSVQNVFVSQHPLLREKISSLRDAKTDVKRFRELIKECGSLLAYETASDLKLQEIPNCQGTLSHYTGERLADNIAVIPVLRAGLGLVDSFTEFIPSASVFHLGIFREKITLSPVEYYNKLPANKPADIAIVLDPMLATGGTAVAAISILKEWGAKRIKFVTVCASQQGIAAIQRAHADVAIHAGVIDDGLTPNGYVLPGFGDAGDRLFNTGLNSH